MGSRRTFLKEIGVAVGACILRPFWAFGLPGQPASAARSVGVYIGTFGHQHPVMCAVLASKVAGLRQSVRRTRRKYLTSSTLAARVEITPNQASPNFKRYLYRQLTRLAPEVHRGIEVYEVHLDDAAAWKGNEAELNARMLRALLESCRLVRFGEISLYADPRMPGTRRVLTGMIRAEFASRFPSVKRFDVFPDNARKHEGIQAAKFVAYAFSQKHRGGDSQGYDLLGPYVRSELDLSGTL